MFAREPERRAVDIDCRLTVAGVACEVDAELAGETAVIWRGSSTGNSGSNRTRNGSVPIT